MKRPNILAWYYEQGLHGLLETVGNYIAFFWRYFSVRELFLTLFYPWHRDVTSRAWRGWNPARSLELFVTNLISRFIGAVVRTMVIFSGVVVVAMGLIVSCVFIFVWVSFPLIFIGLPFLFYLGSNFFIFAAVICVIFAAIVLIAYAQECKPMPEQLEATELYRHPVFDRICARIGILKNDFPVEILESPHLMEDFVKKFDLSSKEFENIMLKEFSRWNEIEAKKKFWTKENLSKVSPIGVQWKYGFTIHLDEYSSELSLHDFSEYAKGDLVGRNAQKDVMNLVLQRPDQNCVLLVGPSGIGKKTLIHDLGRQIRNREIGGYFKNRRLLLLDLGRAISDTINNGEDVENMMRMLFLEAAYAGNIILAIEHLEHYLGKEGNVFHPDISSVLGEFLGIPTFQVIATSTPKEYHQLVEKQEYVSKYFQVVEFSEPTHEQALDILLTKLEQYEKNRVLFTYAALRSTVANAEKHNWEFPMPERAIDLMMEVLTFWEKKQSTMFVMPETVNEYLELKTGIPQGEVAGDERKKLLNLESLLHRHVIGQEEAVDQVAKALRRMRSGVGNANRPIGSFLFLGPTGVGKTETAKALARAYFGDEKHMIRLDMSEFQSPYSLERLIGNSAMNQPGQLATKAKDNPYTLLLLDEIEKAYPAVLDLFLQVLDEGFMTDAFGEKINFRNMIIIATSNAGAPLIKKYVEDGIPDEDIKKQLIDHVIEEGIFRVEFLNRFESVVFFRPLNGFELKSVAKLILQKLSRRLHKEKNIDVDFGDTVADMIIEKGYNPLFGARSLNRYVEGAVEDLIAKKIISGEVKRGERISIDL